MKIEKYKIKIFLNEKFQKIIFVKLKKFFKDKKIKK